MTADVVDIAERSSWSPIDLGPVLAGDMSRPEPTILRRSDGARLLYPARVNALIGESESGKSWLAFAAVAETLRGLNPVVFLDFEDSEQGAAARLLALGVERRDIHEAFVYVRPETKPGPADLAALLAYEPVLVIVDGITEAMNVLGLSPIDNNDAATLYRRLLRPLTRSGAAVVTIDHVAKAEESRGRWAIGAQHKIAGVDGVAIVVERREPFAPGKKGSAVLRLSKDRPGSVRASVSSNDKVPALADFVLDATGEQVSAELLPPTSARERDNFLPTHLMARVSTVLQLAGEPLSLTAIEDRVTGKAQYVRQAVAALIDGGHIETTDGPRGARLHRLVTPYTEAAT